jgi:hypothetical protein
MPKALQKTLLKLVIAGFAALLLFNYPLLSLYRGHIAGLPALYVWLFGLWLLMILVARRVVARHGANSSKALLERVSND